MAFVSIRRPPGAPTSPLLYLDKHRRTPG